MIGMGGPTGLTRTFVRGQAAELFDKSGRAYLDFVAGFGSLNLGHNHPEVVAAVTRALSQQAPVSHLRRSTRYPPRWPNSW